MPRKKRVQFPGAIYHVSTQANGWEALYLDATDYQAFFAFVSRAADYHDLQIHSWCAMATHYHLLLTTPRGDLARAMHRLNSRFAHWFNDVHGEVGHHLRRRYTGVHVETDEHLKWCYRYIAMNPVKAGICDRPEQWRWSSFAWLFGGYTWRIDLPSDELHLFRHWGEGDDGRRRLRRYVETGIA
jgi:putative transposase